MLTEALQPNPCWTAFFRLIFAEADRLRRLEAERTEAVQAEATPQT